MPPHFGNHIIRPLVRDQTASEFYVCFARQHGFAAGPLIAAVETVDLERRAIPLPRQHAVAWLAESGGRANLGEILLLIERQPLERLRKCRIDLFDIVIESFDGNFSTIV